MLIVDRFEGEYAVCEDSETCLLYTSQSFERSGWIRMPERPRPPKERKFSGESVFSEKMEKFSVPLFIEGTISEKKKQARRV